MSSLASDDIGSDYFESGHHRHWTSKTRSLAGDVESRHKPAHEDEPGSQPRKFLIDVDSTMRLVLEQEDTDGECVLARTVGYRLEFSRSFQIHVTDAGPKVFSVGTATSNGFKKFDSAVLGIVCEPSDKRPVRGTWMLSVLLQELALAKDHGRSTIILHESRLTENPVDRLSRFIRTSFWDGLTRRIDAAGLEIICMDPKNRSANQAPRIYVPEREPEMIAYYQRVAAARPHLNLQVEVLPAKFDAVYVKNLNDKPGILALAMSKVTQEDGTTDLKGIPFVVPGARFNELYNWDSYFVCLGLLLDDRLDLAKGIVDHFVFEIKHYGKILNGSRSYYLMRSQPPFLTDLALQIYAKLPESTAEQNKQWLKMALLAAIKEYHTVWMAEPRLDTKTGLSRYRPDGKGVPPETEASHFTHILMPYAQKYGVSVNDFIQKYNDDEVHEPELDEYFMHDRAVRESGHDTYRFEGKCANLATVDLNSLLFKYETDIANAIHEIFDDRLEVEEDYELSVFPFGSAQPYTPLAWSPEPYPAGTSSRTKIQTSSEWFARAGRRQQLMNHYLWHAGQSMFMDYDTATEQNPLYESVTCFWPMWAGVASQEQASRTMTRVLPKFEVTGGLVAGTEASRGEVGLDRPSRQWDYPCAWAPHQMLCWIAFDRYGYDEEAQRCAYRWLYLMTKTFVDHNGIVAEKVDAVDVTHFVSAEYGNRGSLSACEVSKAYRWAEGLDFRHIPKEGFGWSNASYQLGLTFLTPQLRRQLGALTHPSSIFETNIPHPPSSQPLV